MATQRLSDLPADDLRAAAAHRYGAVATAPDGDVYFPVGRAYAEPVDYESALLDALPEAACITLLEQAGLRVEVLQRGRNARTGHPATTALTFRAYMAT